MDPIVQDRLGVSPWMTERGLRLPGTGPVPMSDWLQRDEAFAAQMAERDRLIAERAHAVHAREEGALPAARELLALILDQLAPVPGYAREGDAMRRPDGTLVPLSGEPLVAAGRLVQEDLVLMERAEGEPEHRLTGALLCFPSNWTLRQKLGMPLTRIHLPVDDYDPDVAKRVQRLFDGVRPGMPLMRANLIPYATGDLHAPRAEFDRHRPAQVRFVRSERQTILRLPGTGAGVFSIHVYQVPLDSITGDERERLRAARPAWFEGDLDDIAG